MQAVSFIVLELNKIVVGTCGFGMKILGSPCKATSTVCGLAGNCGFWFVCNPVDTSNLIFVWKANSVATFN